MGKRSKAGDKPQKVTLEDEAQAFGVETSEIETADAKAAVSKVTAESEGTKRERPQIWVQLDDEAQEAWRECGVDLPFPAIVRIAGDFHAAGIIKSTETTEDGKIALMITKQILMDKIVPNRKEYLESRPITRDQAMEQFNEASNRLSFMIRKNPQSDFSSIEANQEQLRVRILDAFDDEDNVDFNREIFEQSKKMIEDSNRVACHNIVQACTKLSAGFGEGVQASVKAKLEEIEPLMQSSIPKAMAKLTKLMDYLEKMGPGKQKPFNSVQQRSSKSVNDLRRSRRRGQEQQR